jgi:hypothetical protein
MIKMANVLRTLPPIAPMACVGLGWLLLGPDSASSGAAAASTHIKCHDLQGSALYAYAVHTCAHGLHCLPALHHYVCAQCAVCIATPLGITMMLSCVILAIAYSYENKSNPVAAMYARSDVNQNS